MCCAHKIRLWRDWLRCSFESENLARSANLWEQSDPISSAKRQSRKRSELIAMKTKSRKPLIMWCRWHDAVLRTRGHDDTMLHGEFYYADEARSEPFTFDMRRWILTRGDDAPIELDDMGVEV